MVSSLPFEYGITLPNGTQIVHGEGANIRHPFTPEQNIPAIMGVYSPGGTCCFQGPSGCMTFTTETRIPRHVHVSSAANDNAPTKPGAGQPKQRFVTERIFVPYGVGLLELSGEFYVIPPRTLVTIAPGVPHTWTACPPGLDVTRVLGSDVTKGEGRVVSEGEFLAVWEYEDVTSFFPTAQTEKLTDVEEYVRFEDLQSIRIPEMSVQQVLERASFVWGRGLYNGSEFNQH